MTIVQSNPIDDIIDGTVENTLPPHDTVIDSIPGGGVAGSDYAYHQVGLASTWVIDHNLGVPREPVVITDDEPTRPVWTDVVHTTNNQAVLIFPQPTSGWAYF